MTTALPSRSEITQWRTDHLTEVADHLTARAETWEYAFATAYKHALDPAGTSWHGKTADAAIDRAHSDRQGVTRIADALHAVARAARSGAARIHSARGQALTAIGHAEEEGFAVGDDLSVSWPDGGSPFTDVVLNARGSRHAATIWGAAMHLRQVDADVADGLIRTAQRADLPVPPPPIETDGDQPAAEADAWHLPPAPPGQEWHYYWTWGWVLEEPLEDCSTAKEVFNLGIIGAGTLRSMVGGPIGVVGGLSMVGKSGDELGHCQPPFE